MLDFMAWIAGCNQLIVGLTEDTMNFVETNENFDCSEIFLESLRAALCALVGDDLKSAQRELEWVDKNLDADESMPYVASILRAIVNELRDTNE